MSRQTLSNTLSSITELILNVPGSCMAFVFGEKCYGKTELLEKVASHMCKRKEYLFININEYSKYCREVGRKEIIDIFLINAIIQCLNNKKEDWKIFNFKVKKVLALHNLSLIKIKFLLYDFKRKKKCKQGIKAELFNKLSSHDLYEILQSISPNDKMFCYVVNLVEINTLNINFLNELSKRNTIKCLFSMRPNKDDELHLKKIKQEANFPVHYYNLSPIKIIQNEPDILTFHPPMTNKIMGDKHILGNQGVCNLISKSSYYSCIDVSPLKTREEILLVAIILGKGEINSGEIASILNVEKNAKRSDMPFGDIYKNIEDNNAIWNINGAYSILDGWREYLYIKLYFGQMLYELKNYYIYIYWYLYTDRNRCLNIVNMEIDKEYCLWINPRWSGLLRQLIFLERKMKVNKITSDETQKKLNSCLIENDFPLSSELFSLTLLLLEDTFSFELLLEVLEKIKVDTSLELKVAKKLLLKVIRYADQWMDITLLKACIEILSRQYIDNSVIDDEISKSLWMLANIRKDEIIRILKYTEGGCEMMGINTIIEKKVFLSFCGKDKDIADIIYDRLIQDFEGVNIHISRYDKDLAYKDHITDFMNSISEHDYVIMLISDQYLKSTGCMYEVLQTVRAYNYPEKILFIILDGTEKDFYASERQKYAIGADIYEYTGVAKYIVYWEQEAKKLSSIIESIEEQTSKIELLEELRKIQAIKLEVNQFIKEISDMWRVTFMEAMNNNFIDIEDIIINS